MIEFLDRFRNDPESKVYFVTDGIEEWHKLNAYEKKNFSNVFAAYDVLANEKGKADPIHLLLQNRVLRVFMICN